MFGLVFNVENKKVSYRGSRTNIDINVGVGVYKGKVVSCVVLRLSI